MVTSANFLPMANTQPYTYLEHYLKIEDSKGKTLFIKTFDSKETLKNEYKKINYSRKPYSFLFRTIFPVRCDSITYSITYFFQILLIPQTLTALSSLKNRVAKVAIGIFTILFDLMTLPVRLMTFIPYIVYYKCCNREDHKIIDMIRSNPAAVHALTEGKVVIRYITEDFSYILPGSLNNEPCYQVEGTVSGACSDVYIKRTLYEGKVHESTEGSISFSGNMNSSIKSHYHAFKVV